MLLVTLEGLPHAGRARILRNLVAQCQDWTPTNVAPDAMSPSCWASPRCRTAHASFAALMRKVAAVSKAGPGIGTMLLNSPWFEHLPRHPALWALQTEATRELVACMQCCVDLHIMIVLLVSHDETFEQMVCCGNPCWNGTSLVDVRTAQKHIIEHLDGLPDSKMHPFPCRTFTIQCPPFFEENEVVAAAITQKIVDIVMHAAMPSPTT